MEWRAQSGWSFSLVDCVEVDLLHPCRKWVVWLWCNVIDIIVYLLVLTRLCCIVCGLPVGFRWSVEISSRMGLLEEWRVLAPPFRHSFRSIEYIKCTLPAHTLAADVRVVGTLWMSLFVLLHPSQCCRDCPVWTNCCFRLKT